MYGNGNENFRNFLDFRTVIRVSIPENPRETTVRTCLLVDLFKLKQHFQKFKICKIQLKFSFQKI